MPELDAARLNLKHGGSYPYDATDEWWEGDGDSPPPSRDWAHAAARGVLSDLLDRGGIKHALARYEIDEECRCDIVDSLAAIILVAAEAR